MNKYVVILKDDANVEAVTERLGNLGARNVTPANLNILLVDSPVKLNLTAEDGIESYQEAQEVDPNAPPPGVPAQFVVPEEDVVDPEQVEFAKGLYDDR